MRVRKGGSCGHPSTGYGCYLTSASSVIGICEQNYSASEGHGTSGRHRFEAEPSHHLARWVTSPVWPEFKGQGEPLAFRFHCVSVTLPVPHTFFIAAALPLVLTQPLTSTLLLEHISNL